MLIRGYEDANMTGGVHRGSNHHQQSYKQQVLLQLSPSPPSSSSPPAPALLTTEETSNCTASSADKHHNHHQNHLLCLLLGPDKIALDHLYQHSLFTLEVFEEVTGDGDNNELLNHFSASPPLNTITTIHHSDSFSHNKAVQLVSTINNPPITELHLVIQNVKHFLSSIHPAIVHLLRSFSSQLTSFKLQLAYPPAKQLNAEYLGPIFTAIAGCCRRLEHLTVELRCSLKSPTSGIFPLLFDNGGLSSLRELNFYSRDEVIFLSELLKLVPVNQQLQRIAFGCSKPPTEMMRRLAAASPDFTTRIVAIVTEKDDESGILPEDRLSLLEMQAFAISFQSLNSLTLNLLSIRVDVHWLLDSILSLCRLLYLKLAVRGGDCILPPGDQLNVNHHPKLSRKSSSPSLPSAPLLQLSPVRVLHLSLAMASHCDLLDLDLPSRFPNLQVLLLEPLITRSSSSSLSSLSSSDLQPHQTHRQSSYYSGIICDICGIKKENNSSSNNFSAIRSCAATLLEHLKVHQRLKVVHLFCRSLHDKVLRIPTAQIDQFISEQLINNYF